MTTPMDKQVKIIQIIQDNDPAVVKNLYGLGDDGVVYCTNWAGEEWEVLVEPNSEPEPEQQKFSDAQILDSMKTRGGGFASALAEACLQADSENLRKVKNVFWELWQEHDELLDQ